MRRISVASLRLSFATIAVGLSLLSCASVWAPAKHVLSAGQFGYQPMVTRPVWCLVDDDFSADDCLAYVVPALGALNHAANHALVRFAGMVASGSGAAQVHRDGALLIAAGELPSDPERTILGVTQPEVDPFTGGIVKVAMLLNRDLFLPMCWLPPQAVVEHELLHAVGFNHSSLRTSSIYPAYSGVTAYSPEDINALRAAYGDN